MLIQVLHLRTLSAYLNSLVRESRDEIPLRGEGCNTPMLIVSLIMSYFANRGLEFVVSVNRVRIGTFVLAMFDLVFVLNLSSINFRPK